MAEDHLGFAGQINFSVLKLISTSGYAVDLQDYLVEVNIFEDIFQNFLYGNMMLSDSRNLISSLPIIGEEYLVIRFETPTLDSFIEKTFKIYSVTDKKTVRDNNTQIYTLHFCSHEAIVDTLTPLYKPFEGVISDVVQNIYKEFLEIPRTYIFNNDGQATESDETTPLYIINETDNRVKFISPGWSPSKCINWLATKSIPSEGKACDFLFWETTKAFYFSNIEKLISDTEDSDIIKGTYFYFPPNVLKPSDSVTKLFIAEEFDVVKTSDNLVNYVNGYLASRIITLDVLNKKYDVTDYDYVDEFSKFKHMSGTNASPLFASDTLRNAATHIKFYPVNTKLFTKFPDNVSEKVSQIYGNRLSKLNELNNFTINILVPGRTDLEAGSLIRFIYPDTEPKESATDNPQDKHYSGVYLITAIRHKINLKKHMMIIEMVKDSLENNS